jgi:hypothetical protein
MEANIGCSANRVSSPYEEAMMKVFSLTAGFTEEEKNQFLAELIKEIKSSRNNRVMLLRNDIDSIENSAKMAIEEREKSIQYLKEQEGITERVLNGNLQPPPDPDRNPRISETRNLIQPIPVEGKGVKMGPDAVYQQYK